MSKEANKYGDSFCSVGLTGGVGAGKSTVLNLFKQEGAITLSTDEVVHKLYDSSEITDPLVERWGEKVAPEGKLSRHQIAEIVFTDLSELEWLEGFLWPHVERAIESWVSKCEQDDGVKLAVVEVPLLFESGIDARFDETVAVTALPEIIEPRLRDRDGQLKLQQRIDRQLPAAEKERLASYTIENNGSITDLSRAVSHLTQQLVDQK